MASAAAVAAAATVVSPRTVPRVQVFTRGDRVVCVILLSVLFITTFSHYSRRRRDMWKLASRRRHTCTVNSHVIHNLTAVFRAAQHPALECSRQLVWRRRWPRLYGTSVRRRSEGSDGTAGLVWRCTWTRKPRGDVRATAVSQSPSPLFLFLYLFFCCHIIGVCSNTAIHPLVTTVVLLRVWHLFLFFKNNVDCLLCVSSLRFV